MAERAIATLAIVGASARAAAFSAVRAGFRVVTADLFADADLAQQATARRISDYPAGFLPWLREQRVSAWMYTGALENYPRLVDQMSRVAPLWGNSGRQLREVRSPIRLAKCLTEAGLSFPEVVLSSQDIPCDGTWLLKPFRGSNGAGIERWTGQSCGTSRRSYWQRSIDGTPCAALFVAREGESRMLGVTRQLVGEAWTGAKPFQYAGSIGLWPMAPSQEAQIERLGHTFKSVFALQGLFGVDLVIDGDSVWVIEVNPRYTAAAEVVERFSGENPISGHLAFCGGNGWMAGPHFGKAIFYAQHDFTISREFFDWAIERSGPSFAAELADIPHAGTDIRAGHPVLTVLADGESPDRVEENLKGRVEEVRSRIESVSERIA